jgi:SAM-dependent methyltransferase
VVHALKRIHRSLRPDGVLLDLHPQPDRPRIEIWQDGHVELLGHIDYEQDIADILNARARLDQVEKDGWYVTYRRMVFELVSHFTSVEEWQTHEWWQGYDTRVPEELLDSARRRLDTGGGEFIVREAIRASLLKPRPKPANEDTERGAPR